MQVHMLVEVGKDVDTDMENEIIIGVYDDYNMAYNFMQNLCRIAEQNREIAVKCKDCIYGYDNGVNEPCEHSDIDTMFIDDDDEFEICRNYRDLYDDIDYRIYTYDVIEKDLSDDDSNL